MRFMMKNRGSDDATEDMPQLLFEDIKALFFGGISLAVEPCAEAYAGVQEKWWASCYVGSEYPPGIHQ